MASCPNILRKGSAGNRDSCIRFVLSAVASVTVLMVLMILVFTVGNGWDALRDMSLSEFLFGSDWDIQSGTFEAGPIILGTFLVTAGAMAISLPLGLGAAIYISEVASPRARRFLKPACEVFAGIPSVVYGFFGLVVVLPILRSVFPDQLLFGNSWLAGSLLLGIMTLPTVITVSEDALHSVPDSYREASLSLGATEWETTMRTVVPAAMSGIMAAAILGVGRAIGETMAVMMVTGNTVIVPDPIYNVFSLISTITGILALQMPEAAAEDELYSALFLLASVLLVMTLLINLVSKMVIRHNDIRMGTASPGRHGTLSRDRGNGAGETVAVALCYLAAGLGVWMFAELFVGEVAALAVSAATVLTLFCVRKVYTLQTRAVRQRICHGALALTMAGILALLVLIIGDILVKGVPAISWEFLTGGIVDQGREGGILPAIVGTLELMAGTAAIALPTGILTGIYLAEYTEDTRFTRAVREAIDLLNGTPSIVFGLFGMAFLVKAMGLGVSMVSGWIILSLMVIPVIIKTTEEALRTVPDELRDASRAMGAGKWRTTVKVVIPAAMGGILTGSILSMGRAAGETAPIMFTAAVTGSTAAFAGSVMDPVMALPYHLYYLTTQVTGSTDMQYGTATVLLLIVLSMFAAASVLRTHYNKKLEGQ